MSQPPEESLVQLARRRLAARELGLPLTATWDEIRAAIDTRAANTFPATSFSANGSNGADTSSYPVVDVGDGMNKTERAYAAHLEVQQRAGVIRRWEREPVKLRLAGRTFYTPDFRVVAADGVLELHEVKGFWRDDARVKIKVAAEQHPYRFVAVQLRRAREGGGWVYERIPGRGMRPGTAANT